MTSHPSPSFWSLSFFSHVIYGCYNKFFPLWVSLKNTANLYLANLEKHRIKINGNCSAQTYRQTEIHLGSIKRCRKNSKPSHLRMIILHRLNVTVNLQAGFSNTWSVNFQMFKLILEKAEEPEIKLPTFAESSKKQESSRRNIYFCFIDYAKAFDCVDHNKLWKILKEMGIPDHLTCLLRNLYAGQDATVKTGHGTDWFQIGKGVHQGCILSPCLFNLYAEYSWETLG